MVVEVAVVVVVSAILARLLILCVCHCVGSGYEIFVTIRMTTNPFFLNSNFVIVFPFETNLRHRPLERKNFRESFRHFHFSLFSCSISVNFSLMSGKHCCLI